MRRALLLRMRHLRQVDKDSDEPEVEDDFDASDSRIIFLYGEVNQAMCLSVTRRLLVLNERGKDPIKLVISTDGGNFDETMAIYDAMKISVAPVHTLGLGSVQSAGCLLLAAGAQGERAMGRNARMMYHAGKFEIEGDLRALRNDLREYTRQEKLFDRLVVRETGLKMKELMDMYKDGDRYLTARQCKKLGFIDRLVG